LGLSLVGLPGVAWCVFWSGCINMETINALMQQAVGTGAGVTLGALIGLSIARKRGNSKVLVADSVLVTAALVGFLAMAVHMFIIYLGVGQ
jgi:hypothetical protein